MLLFVYGTLMKNLYNHHLLSSAVFICKCKTAEKFSLYLEGSIPYLTNRQQLYHIKGELYDVSDDIIKEIDKLESEGEWYHRKVIEIFEKNLKVYAYFNDKDGVFYDTDDYHFFEEMEFKRLYNS